MSLLFSRRPRLLPRRARRAIAAAEFALLLPVITLLVGAVIDLTEYLTIYKVMSIAARNAALDAASVTSVAGASPTAGDLTSIAAGAVDGTMADSGYSCDARCTVSATWAASELTGWSLLSVTVTWNYTSLTGLNAELLDGALSTRFTTLTQFQP